MALISRSLLVIWFMFFYQLAHVFVAVSATPLGDGQVPQDLGRVVLATGHDYPENRTVEGRGIMDCFAGLCCFTSSSKKYLCYDNWPPIASLQAKMAQTGNVGKKTSFFYTNLAGSVGITLAKRWACAHTNYVAANNYVTWDEIIEDTAWLRAQGEALAKVFPNDSGDSYLKGMAQAFAQQTAGDVYLFTPHDQDPLANSPTATQPSAWAGWEYPALQRNPNVGTIYRVDPRDGQDQERVRIWSQEDGITTNEPLGYSLAPSPPQPPS